MLKKQVLYFLIILCIALNVNALTTDDSDLIGYWSMDDSSGTLKDTKLLSILPTYDLNYNGAEYQSTKIPTYSNYSTGFDGTNDIAYNNLVGLQLNKTGGFTASCWANNDGINDDAIMGDSDGINNGWYIRQATDPVTFCRFYDASGDNVASSAQNYKGSMITCIYNNTGVYLYVNSTLSGSKATTATINRGNSAFSIGSINSSGGQYFGGRLDECVLFNRSLGGSEISDLYSNGMQLGTSTTEFLVYGYDSLTGAALTNLTVVMVNSSGTFSFGSGNGLVNTTFMNGIFNLTVSTNQSFYKNLSYVDYDISTGNLAAHLSKIGSFINIIHYGNVTLGNYTYRRNITDVINLTCDDVSNTTLYLFYNNSVRYTKVVDCSTPFTNLTISYKPSTEGVISYKYMLNSSLNGNDYDVNTSLKEYVIDLYAPTITNLNSIKTGSFQVNNGSIYLQCNDTRSPTLNYTLIFNNVTYHNSSNVTGTTLQSNIEFIDGNNYLTGRCSDLFSTTIQNNNFTGYIKQFILIDEIANTDFDVSNLTNVKLYLDDNQTSFNLKSLGTNKINISSIDPVKLRFELEYESGEYINRYIDNSLLVGDVRVCANKDGVTHFEQILTSTSVRKGILKSINTNCYVAADYTRFAYQGSYILKTHTIPRIYTLITNDQSGNDVVLASLDGSIATTIDIDTISFTQTEYSFNVISDALTFNKHPTNPNQIVIRYINLQNSNDAASMIIKNLDNDLTVLSYNSFSNPNNFSIIFDYTTINVTNTTIFVAELSTTQNGVTTVLKRYFNTTTSKGVINSVLAFVIAACMVLFGFTLTSSRSAFSWFGIIILALALYISTLGVAVWYLTFMQVMISIMIVFSVILMSVQNTATVT